MERELKYRLPVHVSPEQVARVTVRGYQLIEPAEHFLDDTIVDTPDGRLAEQQRLLRIRRDGDTTVVTLKGPQLGTGAYHEREEVEVACDRAAAERYDWPDEIRAQLGDALAAGPWTPVLRVRNHRHTWQVARSDADRDEIAEVALDEGVLLVDGGQERFHELEIEIKGAGTLADLDTLGAAFAKALDATPEPRGKAERGAALAARLATPGGEPIIVVAARVLKKNMERLRRAEVVARIGTDPEGIHDLRVATRRLRTALRILEESGVHAKRASRLRRRLRDVAREAAAVRDADVMLADLAEQSDAPPLLSEVISAQRDRERPVLFTMLDSEKTRRLFAEIDQWAATLLERGADPIEPNGQPWLARHFAGSNLWSAYQGVLAYETAFPGAPAETIHQLRIAIKRLRYSVEFFDDGLGPTRKLLRKRLSEAQELLGRHHDAWVQIWLIDDLLRQGRTDPALRSYRAQQLARANALEAEFAVLWPSIAGAEFRALLGSALAAERPSSDDD